MKLITVRLTGRFPQFSQSLALMKQVSLYLHFGRKVT